MPFDRPTLEQIDADLQADVKSRLPTTEPSLRRSYIGALVRGTSGALHELYGYLGWIADQRFTDSADREELVRQGAEYGLAPIAAVRATGTLAVVGTNGVTIPAGTVWRAGNTADYRSTADVTIAGGAAAPAVEAVVGGADGNVPSGTAVTLVNPIAGVTSAASASTAIAGGANEETTDAFRARLNQRKQRPPRGGAPSDYELWARSAHPDVASNRGRVWVERNPRGLGTVNVYLMTYGATDDGIPPAAVVTAVDNFINGGGGQIQVAPVTADVVVAAPAAVDFDVTVTGLDPDSAAVMAAVRAELADLLEREAQPGGTVLVSHVREAISTAAGEVDHELTAPVADVMVAAGSISVIGAVTFV